MCPLTTAIRLKIARHLPAGNITGEGTFHGQSFCRHAFPPSVKRKNVPADCPALLCFGIDDSDIPYTDSDNHPKTGCFPVGIAVCFASELLSGFVRNQCLLSIGITAWNGSEYAAVTGHQKEIRTKT